MQSITGFIPNLSPKGKGNDVLFLLCCKARIEGWFEGFTAVFGKYVGCCNYACSICFFASNAVQAILYSEYKWLVVALQTAYSVSLCC